MNKIETTAGPISHYPSIRPVDEFNLAIMLALGNSYIKKHAEKVKGRKLSAFCLPRSSGRWYWGERLKKDISQNLWN